MCKRDLTPDVPFSDARQETIAYFESADKVPNNEIILYDVISAVLLYLTKFK